MLTSADTEVIAQHVFTIASSHPPRTTQRRGGAHLWVALITSHSAGAATQAAALELLGCIIAERTTT